MRQRNNDTKRFYVLNSIDAGMGNRHRRNTCDFLTCAGDIRRGNPLVGLDPIA